MRKIIIVIVLLTCVLGCVNKAQKNSTISIEQIASDLPSDFKYIVTETKENTNSINVSVEINQKLTNKQLGLLSDLIKAEQKFSKVFIYYMLPQNTNGIVWACAQYNPELKIEIIGSTLDEEKKVNSLLSQIDGKIIGCWYEEEYTSSTKVLLERDNVKYMKTFRKKWNSDEIISKEVPVKLETHPLGIKLIYENTHGEYYVMPEDKGKLMFYNSEGNCFTTALPLKSETFDTKNSQRNKELEIKGNTSVAYTVKKASEDMARKVFVISKGFVKRHLKSPESAVFSSDYDVDDLGEKVYKVAAYVDALNSYGVKTRTNYILKLKLIGEEWSDIGSWQLLSSDYN